MAQALERLVNQGAISPDFPLLKDISTPPYPPGNGVKELANTYSRMLPQQYETVTNPPHFRAKLRYINGLHRTPYKPFKEVTLRVWFQQAIAVVFVLGAFSAPALAQVQLTSDATRIDMSGRLQPVSYTHLRAHET